jgi:hypothetical protein
LESSGFFFVTVKGSEAGAFVVKALSACGFKAHSWANDPKRSGCVNKVSPANKAKTVERMAFMMLAPSWGPWLNPYLHVPCHWLKMYAVTMMAEPIQPIAGGTKVIQKFINKAKQTPNHKTPTPAAASSLHGKP